MKWYSSRLSSFSARRRSAGAKRRMRMLLAWRQSWDFEHRANLDGPLASAGDSFGDTDGLVKLRRVEQEVVADVFARFSEWPVGDEGLAVAHADAGRRRNR